MTTLVVHPATAPLLGSVPVPSDKSIGHRALLLGALCEGDTRITGFSHGEDNVSTANALRAMGVVIDEPGPDGARRPRRRASAACGRPAADLDCGNSGTTMRLLCGVLAAARFRATLVGDETLSRRPMMRVAGPLRLRGAVIDGRPHPTRDGEIVAPLVVGPLPEGRDLGPLEYESPVSSAQVKSAILLSGLHADGADALPRAHRVARPHRAHARRARVPHPHRRPARRARPGGLGPRMPAFDIDIPGDVSAAAFILVAAQLVDGSRVTVRGVGVNPTRTGLLEIARDMGARARSRAAGRARRRAGGRDPRLERAAPRHRHRRRDRAARHRRDPDRVRARRARHGTTRIRDAEELRHKESDRIATMANVLRAFGVACEEQPGRPRRRGPRGARSSRPTSTAAATTASR